MDNDFTFAEQHNFEVVRVAVPLSHFETISVFFASNENKLKLIEVLNHS